MKEIADQLHELAEERYHIPRLSVKDAAVLLGASQATVSAGLQQGVYPWGYATETAPGRWAYFINAVRFAEHERVPVKEEDNDSDR